MQEHSQQEKCRIVVLWVLQHQNRGASARQFHKQADGEGISDILDRRIMSARRVWGQ